MRSPPPPLPQPSAPPLLKDSNGDTLQPHGVKRRCERDQRQQHLRHDAWVVPREVQHVVEVLFVRREACAGVRRRPRGHFSAVSGVCVGSATPTATDGHLHELFHLKTAKSSASRGRGPPRRLDELLDADRRPRAAPLDEDDAAVEVDGDAFADTPHGAGAHGAPRWHEAADARGAACRVDVVAEANLACGEGRAAERGGACEGLACVRSQER